ncbi:MAG: T9SS type A sorting domain-containing protein, partial [Bacteroidetes bacterium]|nr:T9SS type A sorting domain-containing protein [Bacteroidota bacterium]
GLDSAGIPLNGVDFVYRDRSGRIWLNTNENIYQYEGNAWTELVQNFGTIDVCEDDQNGIWVTRNNGAVHQLYKYVNDSLEIRNSSNSNLPSDFYSSVYRDWEDWVWMGGNPGKLTWFRNGTWSSSDLRNDVISDRVNLDIETGKNNHIWFLFEDSLQLTNASRVGWTTVNFPAGIGGEKIIPVKNYGGQFFYLFSDYQHRNTVTIHENGQWSVFDTTDAFSSGTELVDLAVDTLDRLWALARNELYLKTSSGWTRFAPDNSNMPSGNYEALVGDKQGNIWIVTEKAEGIFSFDGQNFSNVFTNASPWLITQPKIQMHADDNAIYVYAEEGAFQFKNSQFSSLNLGLNSISDLKSNGDTLIISNDDGLWFWTENDSIVRSLTPSNSLLRFGKPGPFAIDRFNNYWIGNRDETKGALSIYNLFSVFYPDLIESIDHSPSLNWDLQAYPNPSAGEFNISIHLNHSSPLYGKLFDINGRMIWQRKFTFSDQQEFTLDLSDQPTGVYIINLTDGVNQISQKLIKY